MNRNMLLGLLVLAAAQVAFDHSQRVSWLLWSAFGGLLMGLGPGRSSEE